MLRSLPVLAAAALLLVQAYVHGLWTGRWQPSTTAEVLASRLAEVSLKIGDWEGQPAEPLSAKEVEQAGYSGYLRHRFENRRTGQAVDVLLACGPARHLAVHTPDICFKGAGFHQSGPVEAHVQEYAGGNTWAELQRATFAAPQTAAPGSMRVYWTWNRDGSWKAPSLPRLLFAGSSALYKLYVNHSFVGADARAADEACESFLRAFLPELDRALSPRSEPKD